MRPVMVQAGGLHERERGNRNAATGETGVDLLLEGFADVTAVDYETQQDVSVHQKAHRRGSRLRTVILAS